MPWVSLVLLVTDLGEDEEEALDAEHVEHGRVRHHQRIVLFELGVVHLRREGGATVGGWWLVVVGGRWW